MSSKLLLNLLKSVHVDFKSNPGIPTREIILMYDKRYMYQSSSNLNVEV